MTAAPPVDPLADALLALRLFLIAPDKLGGLCLRGGGPARDLVIERLHEQHGQLRRLPPHVDDERLLGGVDIAASLAAGSTVRQRGILEKAGGTILIAAMAERMTDALAGRLAQQIDTAETGNRFGLILLDDEIAEDEAPAASLLERVAFICDLTRAAALDAPMPDASAIPIDAVAPLEDDALEGLAATAAALGVGSIRPLIFAAEAARAHAALQGRKHPSTADLQASARLVLAPRATQLPPLEDEETPEPDRETGSDGERDQSDPGDRPLEDVVLEAAAAAIPPDLLAQLSSGKSKRRAQGSGGGRRRKSTVRGKPLGARPGMPRGGARLALIDSLRAAVPWQPLRRREAGLSERARLILHKQDLRVRRFEERAAKVTIFCVDASGSAAAARLAEAKGAVELMLAQAYTTRSEVALVAFRGTGAELLLPPTRSLTRARRALAELPGGGGTPLAAGLQAAREVAEAVELRGRTPSLVILTDGRANIAADGSASRSRAADDADAAAKAIAVRGIEALVVDISPRSTPDAARLAQAMQARFLALPLADARRLHAAVGASTQARAA
ncbi:magnesium chelatase subunit D [Qipengyuania sp.]|uniref:magnesium chelatase subunit D n=1 Tax=Qipengyuania sp. TaxID=2004515 RepID=UPI003BAAB797